LPRDAQLRTVARQNVIAVDPGFGRRTVVSGYSKRAPDWFPFRSAVNDPVCLPRGFATPSLDGT
jgi:hypothetical protein